MAVGGIEEVSGWRGKPAKFRAEFLGRRLTKSYTTINYFN